MTGTEGAEMTVVEGRKLRLAESLDDGQDGGVDQAYVSIGVSVTHFSDAPVILGLKIFNEVRTGDEVVQERHQHPRVQASVNPVVQLHEHRRRDDERLVCLFDEHPAAKMVGVGAVQRRVNGARVQDQRHERGSARSNAVREAVSVCPDAPTPRLRGRGRYLVTFSSSASLTKAAIEVRCSAASRRNRSSRSLGTEIVVRSMTS